MAMTAKREGRIEDVVVVGRNASGDDLRRIGLGPQGDWRWPTRLENSVEDTSGCYKDVDLIPDRRGMRVIEAVLKQRRQDNNE